MNYLNQLLGIFRQFTRPIFSHLRNSLPVLLTLGLILIFVGIWTYGTSWSFTGLSNEKGWDYDLANYCHRCCFALFSHYCYFETSTQERSLKQRKK